LWEEQKAVRVRVREGGVRTEAESEVLRLLAGGHKPRNINNHWHLKKKKSIHSSNPQKK
jgi:hypothetical protein